ncbi:hypothetical protein GF367_01155 [Candidatus Woesearchaeota archaeon]|nr:hypothetical protein [Candidatus Woesearchaeota archaeon]
MRRHVILSLLILIVIAATGCEVFEERFLVEKEDSRLLDNDLLMHPASSQEPFTTKPITLRRSSSTVTGMGFYNDQGPKTVLIADPDVQVGFNQAETKHTIHCADEQEYDYTLYLDAPIVDVQGRSAIGMEVIIMDEHGLTADTLTCPVVVVDRENGDILAWADLEVTMTD